MTNIISPFQGSKIKVEDYCLTQEPNYIERVTKVFLAAKVENNNQSTSVPFPLLSTTEQAVWKEYCPNQAKLSETNVALHDRALMLVEKYNEMFDWFEVWAESGDQIDPLLIGKKYQNDDDRGKGYTWNAQTFLLCRWGEALRPFKDIKEAVFNSYVRKEKIRLQKDLNNLEFDAMQKFGFDSGVTF